MGGLFGQDSSQFNVIRSNEMKQKPRIVHVYKDIYPPVEGGIERIVNLMASLTSEAFDVRVIVASRSRRGGRRTIEGRVPVTEVPCLGRALSTPLAPGFLTALRRSGADLFHFHVPHPTGEFAFLASMLKTPAVATYHSDVVRQKWAMCVYRPFFDRFLRRMRVIMPTSQRYLETSPSLAAHRERCRVVPLGYPLEDYAADEAVTQRAEALRRQHGRYALFLGCLRAYKGLPFLLEAMAALPEARLLVAGDGVQRPALEAQANELGLGERVSFLGRVDQAEAVALLHGAAMFVLPAHQRSEAFGLCQIEAMACALPVISTDLATGVPEVNVHGETGLIVPPGDAASLARAIGDLLADPERCARLGESGRLRAQEHYHARLMAERVAEVYREVLSRGR